MRNRLWGAFLFLAVSPLTLLFFIALAVAGAILGRHLRRTRPG